MPPRDYKSSPVSDRLNIEVLINGLAGDLNALRAGEISVQDAIARAVLAKQMFNGVRLYLNGMKMLSENAREVKEVEAAK